MELGCDTSHLGDHELSWVSPSETVIARNSPGSTVITGNGRFTLTQETIREVTRWKLIVRNVSRADSGRYACQINTSPLMEETIWLEVAMRKPALWSNNITAIEGTTASLECRGQGIFRIAWISENTKRVLTAHAPVVTSDPRVSAVDDSHGNMTKGSLIIKNVSREDEGWYTCKATTVPMMTTSVFLTVQETEPESPPRASLEPALWSNLSNLNATEGSTVALECSVRNQGNYSLRWSNSTRSLSTSALARDLRVFVKKEILRDVTKWSLMIKNVSKEDEGKYYCFINSNPPITVVLNLSVQELPKSVLEPTLWSNSYNHSVQGLDSDNLPTARLEPTLWSNSPNHSVVEGSTAVLECNVSNQGNYKLIWIFVPRSLLLTISTHTSTIDPRYSASRESQGDVTKWSLTIKNTTREDEGSYICQVNTEFKKYFIVNLTIQEPDSKLHPMSLEPTLWSNYPNSTAIEGLNVVLECSVGNQGDYRIAWIFVPTEQILKISTRDNTRSAIFCGQRNSRRCHKMELDHQACHILGRGGLQMPTEH